MARRIEDVLINVLGAQQLQLAQNAAVIESLQEALNKVEAEANAAKAADKPAEMGKVEKFDRKK